MFYVIEITSKRWWKRKKKEHATTKMIIVNIKHYENDDKKLNSSWMRYIIVLDFKSTVKNNSV